MDKQSYKLHYQNVYCTFMSYYISEIRNNIVDQFNETSTSIETRRRCLT